MTYEELQDAIDAVERSFSQLLTRATGTTTPSAMATIAYTDEDNRLPGKFYGPKTQMVIDAAIQYADQLKSEEDDAGLFSVKDGEADFPAWIPGWYVDATWTSNGDLCGYRGYRTMDEAVEFLEWLYNPKDRHPMVPDVVSDAVLAPCWMDGEGVVQGPR